MFSLFFFACTELKPAVPGVDPATDPATLTPATSDPLSLAALTDRMTDRFCDTLATCEAGSPYEAMYEANCLDGSWRAEPDCAEPDTDQMNACVEASWSCEGGLQVPAVCEEICPADQPEPVPGEECGRVLDWSGGPLFYRAPLRFRFDQVDPSAAVSLEADGVYFGGDLEWDGTDLVFTPPPLPPGADVAIDVVSCDNSETYSVDTVVTDFGGPLQASANGAYRVDLSEGTFVEPPGLGALVADEITRPVFIGVVESAGSLQVAVQEGSDQGQNTACNGESATGWTGFSDSPWFEVSYPVAQLPRSATGDGVWIYDLTLSGAFDPSATQIGGLTMRGLADASEITGGGSCAALLGPMGIDCVPCPNGVVQCVELEISGLTAEYQWWVEELGSDFLDQDCAG